MQLHGNSKSKKLAIFFQCLLANVLLFFTLPHHSCWAIRVSGGQRNGHSIGNGTPLVRLEGGHLNAVAGTTQTSRRRTTPHQQRITTIKPPTSIDSDEDDDGSYYDNEEAGPAATGPNVGPIILPPGSVESDESADDDDEDDDADDELVPAPDHAGNCRTLARFCHQRAYRRLLQRFCQKTCGRDDCLDQREDLCVHWQRRGFCNHPFYEHLRWRCARTCGMCRPVSH